MATRDVVYGLISLRRLATQIATGPFDRRLVSSLLDDALLVLEERSDNFDFVQTTPAERFLRLILIRAEMQGRVIYTGEHLTWGDCRAILRYSGFDLPAVDEFPSDRPLSAFGELALVLALSEHPGYVLR